MNQVPGRLGLMQRILPVYRRPFFDMLALACRARSGVLAGDPRPKEMVEPCKQLEIARLDRSRNVHLLDGQLYMCWQSGITSWLQDWQPDVLIVEANPRYLATGSAVRWMHRHNRPVIGWGLGAPAAAGPLLAVRRLARQMFLRQFESLITYSAQGAREYQKMGFPTEKIFVAPNAVAARPAKPAPYRMETVGCEPPSVIFVGRLQARKRVNLLIQACARARMKPRLWIVGDGPERPALEWLAKTEYPETVFRGALHGEQLEPLLDQADLFILPGTGGLAVQQAMSHALPVMVAEADGTQSDLVRPANGWLLPPGNLDVLVSRMDEALGDLPRLRKMGLESYRIVDEEINLEKMTSVFIEAVRSVWKE